MLLFETRLVLLAALTVQAVHGGGGGGTTHAYDYVSFITSCHVCDEETL